MQFIFRCFLRSLLCCILKLFAENLIYIYISTSFTPTLSSDNNASKSPKTSQTVAVLSFG